MKRSIFLLVLLCGCTVPSAEEGVVIDIVKVAGKSYEEKYWNTVGFDGETLIQVEKTRQIIKNYYWSVNVKLDNGQIMSYNVRRENPDIEKGSRLRVEHFK